jgi:hypothetical protein
MTVINEPQIYSTLKRIDSLYWRNLLAIILCVLVFSRSLGFLFGIPLLEMTGRTLMMSPLPLPFHSYAGYENFSTQLDVTVRYLNGTKESLDLKESYKNLPGPHRSKIPLVYGIWMGPVYSESLTRPIYNRLFCEGNLFGFEEKVFYIDILYTSRVDQNNQWLITHICQ